MYLGDILAHFQPMTQKIKNIQVIPLVRRLNRAFQGSTYQIVSRNTLFVRVETEEGILGEAFGGDEDIYQAKVVAVANEFLAPRIIGMELLPIEELWQAMISTAPLPFHNRGIHTLDLINHAVLMQAIAIIDLGLWDTLGKALNKPVWRLLGGFRNKVPVIGIGGYHRSAGDLEGLVSEVESFLAFGLSGIKLKVGSLQITQDLKRVETLRKHFGKRLLLCCDANQAWTFDEEPQVALHLLASVPNSTYVEVFPDPERDPMWHELPENRPPIRDGYMEASEKPGFGLAYNREIIDIYRGDVARSLP